MNRSTKLTRNGVDALLARASHGIVGDPRGGCFNKGLL